LGDGLDEKEGDFFWIDFLIGGGTGGLVCLGFGFYAILLFLEVDRSFIVLAILWYIIKVKVHYYMRCLIRKLVISENSKL
jgi:hypothetical protein